MKYAYIALIFIAGVAIGRWSVTSELSKSASTEKTSQVANLEEPKEMQPADSSENLKPSQNLSTTNESASVNAQHQVNQDLLRTNDKAKDKEIRALYSRLVEAEEKSNIEEQNRLFAEMEALNPRHENVFQAKASFLEDDDNWEGAYTTYKECVAANPESVACLRRLTNIRSSIMDDKIKYGMLCLEVSKDDPLCLIDVAIALQARGESAKAKVYFERALSLPQKGTGYHRNYILLHYGYNLESLSMHREARKAFTESCRLNMKSACEKLK